MTRSEQLPLDFPEKSLGFDTLAVTPANAAAVRAVQNTPRWPYHVF